MTGPWRRFGLLDFIAMSPGLPCADCEAVGRLVASAPNPHNGGVRPICTACGSMTPLPHVLWLSRTMPARSAEKLQPLIEYLREGVST